MYLRVKLKFNSSESLLITSQFPYVILTFSARCWKSLWRLVFHLVVEELFFAEKKTTALEKRFQPPSSVGKMWMSQSHHWKIKENSRSLCEFWGAGVSTITCCLCNGWCWIWMTLCGNLRSIYHQNGLYLHCNRCLRCLCSTVVVLGKTSFTSNFPYYAATFTKCWTKSTRAFPSNKVTVSSANSDTYLWSVFFNVWGKKWWSAFTFFFFFTANSLFPWEFGNPNAFLYVVNLPWMPSLSCVCFRVATPEKVHHGFLNLYF